MDISKKEYLQSLHEKSASAINLVTKESKIKMMKISLAYFAVAIVLTGLGVAFTSFDKSSQYEKVVNGESIQYEHLNYKDTFNIWNKNYLGNDINTLLTGGKILAKEDTIISCSSIDVADKSLSVIENASYLNILNNTIVYRDDNDRHIYIVDKSLKQKQCIYSGNSGEVLVAGGKIYFIDYDRQSNICAIEGNDISTKEVIVSQQVKAFAVVNDIILYLNVDHELFYTKLGDKSNNKLTSGVERFFLNGDIIVESLDKIIAFSPTGANSRLLFKGNKESMRLVGISGKRLFIEEDGSFYSVQDGKMVGEVVKCESRIEAVTLAPNGSLYVVMSKAKDDKDVFEVHKLEQK